MSHIYLSEINNLHEPGYSDDYPFNIPAIMSLKLMSFTTAVTISNNYYLCILLSEDENYS